MVKWRVDAVLNCKLLYTNAGATGKEVTSNFYTEEQAVSIFNRHQQHKPSAYTFTCIEDCIMVVGDLEVEKDMFQKHSQLETMIRKIVEENQSEVQDEWASGKYTEPKLLQCQLS